MWRRFLFAPRTADTSEPKPEPWGLVLAAYVLFPLVSLAIALVGLRVTSADQLAAAPLVNYHDGDTLLILPMVKDAVERANIWHNTRLGAPGEFQLYDFPVIDHLHFAGLWVVGLFTGSYVTAFNVYFVLTYPLATLTTLGVFRRFGFSLPAAGVGGLLYAFLHYHATRSQAHYFLSAYWVIPLSLYVVLQTARGEPPLTEKRDGQLRWAFWRWGSLAAVVIALMSALAGAYYGFFTCALLAFASVYGSVAVKSWKPALAGGLLVGVIWAGGIAAHAPSILFHLEHGPNSVPTRRMPIEAEMFGLKLADMLLPHVNHQCPVLAKLAAKYHEGRPLPSENIMAPMGFVIAAGIVGVGVMFMLPRERRWPYGPLGALVIFALLLGTVGGLGALFNFFVTAQIRAYSRISVFIAFFGLFASFWRLDTWFARWPLARWVFFLLLAPVCIVDQTPRPWFREEIVHMRERNAAQFASDHEFFAGVEEVLPNGTVFALPHIPYPEGVMRHRMSSAYRFAAGYLHTKTVRWSFGAMREREINRWQEQVAAEPLPRMLPRLLESGFDAVCVDVYGYPEDEGKKLVAELTALCGPPVASQADGSRILFDLRPLRTRGSR